MKLQKYLEHQRQLQQLMGQPMGVGENVIKENILALIVETTELLNEFNWKPWRMQQKPRDKIAIKHELVDIMKFYCNIINELDISEDEFDISWLEVQTTVRKRISNGY